VGARVAAYVVLERGPRGAQTTEADHEGPLGGFRLSMLPQMYMEVEEYKVHILPLVIPNATR
jgi:hypothetical protein